MRIERLRELPASPRGANRGAPAGPAVVAVGNFDGVHRGHRMGLQLAREEARERGAECVAVTFDPHPARLLRPDRAPGTITSFTLKAERLAAAGVERLVVLEFGEAMARTSPADFVSRLLVDRLGAVTVVQGANFRFGRGRAGDLETLRALGDRLGFRVIEAPSVSWEGAVVSSTRIRRTLAEGNIEAGAALLGACYEIDGAVVSGRGRGRGARVPHGEPGARRGRSGSPRGLCGGCGADIAGRRALPGRASLRTATHVRRFGFPGGAHDGILR